MFILQDIAPEEIARIQDSLKTVKENFIDSLQSNPSGILHEFGQSAIQFGLKVLAALVIYSVGAWLIKLVKKWLRRGFNRKGTEETVASFILSLVSITLTILLVIITVSTLGINTTSLAALLAAGGMAIGMAMSGTVQNFAGGIMLLVFKPFKAGDLISAQGHTGVVEEVNITATRIRTPDNRVIVLPNGALSSGTIENISQKPLRRIDIKVGVEYGTDFDVCQDSLMEIIRSDSRALDASTPGAADPFVALLSMDDSCITFITRTWVRSEDYWGLYFELNRRFYKELPQKGCNFAFPHMDVTLTNFKQS